MVLKTKTCIVKIKKERFTADGQKRVFPVNCQNSNQFRFTLSLLSSSIMAPHVVRRRLWSVTINLFRNSLNLKSNHLDC
jgi:hypothetical protein